MLTADGTAQWTIPGRGGATTILCAANGPLEPKGRDELPTMAALEVVVRPLVGLPTYREAMIEERIYTVVDACVRRKRMPRSLVQLGVQVIEPGESKQHTAREVCAAINAASLALAISGVPMVGLVAAVVVAFGDSLKVNPCSEDLETAESVHTLAFLSNRLVLCDSSGTFLKSQLLQAIEVARKAATEIINEQRTRLEAGVQRGLTAC